METDTSRSFLARNEFLIRRLHSLSGLIPVGAYMVVHLLVNASVNSSPETFQQAVYGIHSLGSLLLIVEWAFIFIPLIFHTVIGVIIIRGGLPNTGNYPLAKNYRYTMQRASGMIAMLFIFWHVFHMHGWIHADWWIKSVAEPLNGAEFDPYNASSSAARALQPIIVVVLYVIGVLSCVFHLANGIWTMGITWGLYTTPAAQRRADYVCKGFGIVLAVISMSALFGMRNVDIDEAKKNEDKTYNSKVDNGTMEKNEHKRTHSKSEATKTGSAKTGSKK